MDFWKTRMGKQLVTQTLPQIAASLTRIANSIERSGEYRCKECGEAIGEGEVARPHKAHLICADCSSLYFDGEDL